MGIVAGLRTPRNRVEERMGVKGGDAAISEAVAAEASTTGARLD